MKFRTDMTAPKLFNTPLEVGFRILIIMNEFKDAYLDLEILMYLDFLSLNSFDVGGPESLSPAIPNRGVQVYARKEIMRNGLVILLSKELVELTTSKAGFGYKINEAGVKFLSLFTTKYYQDLTSRSTWLAEKFRNIELTELRSFMTKNIPNWGSDFLEPETE